ncbi:outer membrane lipoprotein SlyB [Duganella sp. 1411]|uniref:glycine zipper 2TM domain-containing protein n=1 Tax=Duganella sp. 1411 TaxID=2806572 RepID=UPI001AE1D6F8|nr:glycine zipper 2TM domain-containing protein [Duganella sp. 1411]MBP1206387.1 outer membrane lipoprotein SlyB [Duganella sp. 1411]
MNNNTSNSKLHPMIMAAAAAVVLVSGVGVAAIMGWLPSSNSQNQDPSLAPNGQPLAAQSAPAPAREQVREPVREAVRDKPVVKHTPVKSAPAVCHSCGVVEAVNEIETRAEGSGVGAVGGALVGGLLGNQVGAGNGRKLATVAGAIGGAVAGNQIEGRVKANKSYDITVRMNDGSVRKFHQTEQPSWHQGDDVRVVDGGLRPID